MDSLLLMVDRATYGWVNDGDLAAVCVTVVPGVEVGEVLTRLGADTSRVLGPDDEEAYGEAVAVTAVAGGVVAVEPNGFQGAREDVLLRVAGDGVAACVFWNVEGDNAFVLVRDGVVMANVDLYDALDGGDAESMIELGLPVELHDLWAQAAGDDDEPWPLGLAMAEAATGVVTPREAVVDTAVLHPLPQG